MSAYGSYDHNAFATRFTVQYNLYAGSVVALGSDAQRASLYATQANGALGCFAFTEASAGVMSGLGNATSSLPGLHANIFIGVPCSTGVDTIARYNGERKGFIIDTPNDGARKNWISQGIIFFFVNRHRTQLTHILQS